MLEDDSLNEESFLKLPEIPELRMKPEETVDGKNISASSPGPKLYVRDDGTVDWEGALQDRAALRKFGSAVWARINGQTPDDLDEESEGDDDAEGATKKKNPLSGAGHGHGNKPKAAVVVKIEETAAIQEARKELNKLQAQLEEMEKAHTALLASGETSMLQN
jgi:hypothetical protein